MDVKIILKNNPHQEQVNIFLAGIQFRIWKFGGIKNKHDVYGCEYCIEKFCKSLRKHVMKIINFEKK